MDSAIHWINHYPVDIAIGFRNTYPLDINLSGGKRYPTLEQLGPDVKAHLRVDSLSCILRMRIGKKKNLKTRVTKISHLLNEDMFPTFSLLSL